VRTEEKVNGRYPLPLTTGRILSQYNVGAQTRRTENVAWHKEDRLKIGVRAVGLGCGSQTGHTKEPDRSEDLPQLFLGEFQEVHTPSIPF
jgi:hypothetical protein